MLSFQRIFYVLCALWNKLFERSLYLFFISTKKSPRQYLNEKLQDETIVYHTCYIFCATFSFYASIFFTIKMCLKSSKISANGSMHDHVIGGCKSFSSDDSCWWYRHCCNVIALFERSPIWSIFHPIKREKELKLKRSWC